MTRLRIAKHLLLSIGVIGLLISCSDNPTGTNGNNGGGGSGGDNGSTTFDHSRGPGQSSAAFLRSDNFNHLVVELDYVANYEPTDEALDSLRSMLENRLHKPGGIRISISGESIGNGGEDSYSTAEIRSLEHQHRDRFTHGDTLAAYLLFLDGAHEQENVLGLAYYNTSMAVLEETIRNKSGGLGGPSRAKIEATVMNHEFGHILGLVDSGTPMQSDHKTDGSDHCTADQCLMRPSVNTSDFFSNVFDGSIPDFDAQCLADLQAHGGR